MKITIKSIHFEASNQLEAFIQKKINRLSRFNNDISVVDVTLKVIKPETNANKDASVKFSVSGNDFLAQEVADTFEEAIDNCVEKLERQIIKAKEKQRS
ncbi:MAG: hypothetical protein EZS26_000332 [Candidatus Ordinivivax streblomastigis]|uniref:Ribosome-associated translation inhibitor RaiA n=1 Tax=Candidatus Ordinivivax streblomastigis TaxID=2540710 RepID=A0A5M8P5S0_9BACT|nr:MAG: hypothetical protein EZS26_000332 [Candidatus Ordinivivax streblomastigis]